MMLRELNNEELELYRKGLEAQSIRQLLRGEMSSLRETQEYLLDAALEQAERSKNG